MTGASEGKKQIHKNVLFPVKSINQMFRSEDLVESKHAKTFLRSPCATAELTREKRCGCGLLLLPGESRGEEGESEEGEEGDGESKEV